MPVTAWRALDLRLARPGPGDQTPARAMGRVLMELVDVAGEETARVHWLDFERAKAARLLAATRAA